MGIGVIKNSMISDDKLVNIAVSVPRKFLDLLSFRYYSLNIAENDTALAQTAIEEIAAQQFGQEFGLWNLRNQMKTTGHVREFCREIV